MEKPARLPSPLPWLRPPPPSWLKRANVRVRWEHQLENVTLLFVMTEAEKHPGNAVCSGDDGAAPRP